MGKIITVASQKGGVGKTTTALNFAYSLCRLGERVLLLDADPQGGMTISTNIRKKTNKGLYDYLSGECKINEVAFYTKEKKLAIMGIGTAHPEAILQLEGWARDGVLASTLKRFGGHFDYLIIDAPAGLGSLVTALLNASDGVILAAQCKALALKSLSQFLSLINWVRNHDNQELRLEGVVLTMRNADDATENELFEEISTSFPEDLLYETAIAYDPVYEAASIKAIPVAMLNDGQRAARNYFALATEYKEREMLADAKGEEDGSDTGLF